MTSILTSGQLVENHLPLVAYAVRETIARVPSHVDRGDLHSAGLLGLVNAAQAYDPERGVPFNRYAMTRIRGTILDELRSVDWASRSVRRLEREIAQVRQNLATTLGGVPDDAQVADALGLSLAEVQQVNADVARAAIVPLEVATEDGPEWDSVLPTPERGPEEELLLVEKKQFLVDAIAELPERLAYVVKCYFLEERPMAEIASVLGVTESRISQLRAEALLMMRDAFSAAFDEAQAAAGMGNQGVAARRREAYTASVAARHAERWAAVSARELRDHQASTDGRTGAPAYASA